MNRIVNIVMDHYSLEIMKIGFWSVERIFNLMWLASLDKIGCSISWSGAALLPV